MLLDHECGWFFLHGVPVYLAAFASTDCIWNYIWKNELPQATSYMKMVAYVDINWARCTVTSLIENNLVSIRPSLREFFILHIKCISEAASSVKFNGFYFFFRYATSRKLDTRKV